MLTYKNKKADDNLTTFIMGSDNPEYSVRFEKFMQGYNSKILPNRPS